MAKLKHITLGEYSQLSENDRSLYDQIISSTIPSGKTIRVKLTSFAKVIPAHEDVWDFTFSDIIELKMALSELKELDLLKEIARIVYSVNDIERVNILDLRVLNWVVDAMTMLLETERAELAYEPSKEEKKAGIEELERFGFAPTVDSLAGGDPTKEEAILLLPYHKVFQKMALNKAYNSIQKNMTQNAGR